jgi:hypothetical protein
VTPSKAPGNEPIDAVCTWSGGEEVLRFSLRSLERYAPWLRKVHLVSGGPAPAWINAGHQRIAIVRHEDIFRDRGALPTSNPDAIAWQLFRIPGLSRQFLYLDDRLFLSRRLAPQDFLTPKGGYRFYAADIDVPSTSTAAGLLNSRFGNRASRKMPVRTPQLLDRNFLEEVHRLWEKPIKQTSISLETLYFYYLLECPQQYGAHEQTTVTTAIFRSAPLSDAKQVAGILWSRPKFFRLEGSPAGAMTHLLLKLFYWRRSPLEGKG